MMSQAQQTNAKGILTKDQRVKYAEVFVNLDTNADGWLSRAECTCWMRQAGFHTLSDTRLEAIFRSIDVNQDGKITYDEFLMVMELAHKPPARNTLAEEIFLQLDKNRDGYLTEDELFRGLQECGYSFTRQKIRKLISNLDRDRDGRISYQEFLQWFE